MRPRVKKLIGTSVLVVGISLYALTVMVVGDGRIRAAGPAVQLVYFAVFGLLWIIPAGLLIRWMERVDQGQ